MCTSSRYLTVFFILSALLQAILAQGGSASLDFDDLVFQQPIDEIEVDFFQISLEFKDLDIPDDESSIDIFIDKLEDDLKGYALLQFLQADDVEWTQSDYISLGELDLNIDRQALTSARFKMVRRKLFNDGHSYVRRNVELAKTSSRTNHRIMQGNTSVLMSVSGTLRYEILSNTIIVNNALRGQLEKQTLELLRTIFETNVGLSQLLDYLQTETGESVIFQNVPELEILAPTSAPTASPTISPSLSPTTRSPTSSLSMDPSTAPSSSPTDVDKKIIGTITEVSEPNPEFLKNKGPNKAGVAAGVAIVAIAGLSLAGWGYVYVQRRKNSADDMDKDAALVGVLPSKNGACRGGRGKTRPLVEADWDSRQWSRRQGRNANDQMDNSDTPLTDRMGGTDCHIDDLQSFSSSSSFGGDGQVGNRSLAHELELAAQQDLERSIEREEEQGGDAVPTSSADSVSASSYDITPVISRSASRDDGSASNGKHSVGHDSLPPKSLIISTNYPSSLQSPYGPLQNDGKGFDPSEEENVIKLRRLADEFIGNQQNADDDLSYDNDSIDDNSSVGNDDKDVVEAMTDYKVSVSKDDEALKGLLNSSRSSENSRTHDEDLSESNTSTTNATNKEFSSIDEDANLTQEYISNEEYDAAVVAAKSAVSAEDGHLSLALDSSKPKHHLESEIYSDEGAMNGTENDSIEDNKSLLSSDVIKQLKSVSRFLKTYESKRKRRDKDNQNKSIPGGNSISSSEKYGVFVDNDSTAMTYDTKDSANNKGIIIPTVVPPPPSHLELKDKKKKRDKNQQEGKSDETHRPPLPPSELDKNMVLKSPTDANVGPLRSMYESPCPSGDMTRDSSMGDTTNFVESNVNSFFDKGNNVKLQPPTVDKLLKEDVSVVIVGGKFDMMIQNNEVDENKNKSSDVTGNRDSDDESRLGIDPYVPQDTKSDISPVPAIVNDMKKDYDDTRKKNVDDAPPPPPPPPPLTPQSGQSIHKKITPTSTPSSSPFNSQHKSSNNVLNTPNSVASSPPRKNKNEMDTLVAPSSIGERARLRTITSPKEKQDNALHSKDDSTSSSNNELLLTPTVREQTTSGATILEPEKFSAKSLISRFESKRPSTASPVSPQNEYW
eukprot:CAMPEP_0184858162 /NCGR_PEP_ID=MMETSP0580-20130426/3282_1 /TAXON_ID=1118495 /ORGANISM="Dactyliosolen fragilissimus" /LENGTH=1117 /DNA_ID=CAMNT_0027354151 /DNA_START=340 /DNA_END=3690 /DNA_ORIENTATION=+